MTPEANITRARNIRAVWDALLAPNWTKDDLIDLGKAVYARTPLKNLDPAKFERLLPHLVAVTEKLESNIAPLTPAGPTGLAGPGPCPTGPAGSEGPAGQPRTTEPTGPSASPVSRPHHKHSMMREDDARLGSSPTAPANSADPAGQPRTTEPTGPSASPVSRPHRMMREDDARLGSGPTGPADPKSCTTEPKEK